jgi:hypothetical protein
MKQYSVGEQSEKQEDCHEINHRYSLTAIFSPIS